MSGLLDADDKRIEKIVAESIIEYPKLQARVVELEAELDKQIQSTVYWQRKHDELLKDNKLLQARIAELEAAQDLWGNQND